MDEEQSQDNTQISLGEGVTVDAPAQSQKSASKPAVGAAGKPADTDVSGAGKVVNLDELEKQGKSTDEATLVLDKALEDEGEDVDEFDVQMNLDEASGDLASLGMGILGDDIAKQKKDEQNAVQKNDQREVHQGVQNDVRKDVQNTVQENLTVKTPPPTPLQSTQAPAKTSTTQQTPVTQPQPKQPQPKDVQQPQTPSQQISGTTLVPDKTQNLSDLRQKVLQESTMAAHDTSETGFKPLSTPEPPLPEERMGIKQQVTQNNDTSAQGASKDQSKNQSPDLSQNQSQNIPENIARKSASPSTPRQNAVPIKDIQTMQVSQQVAQTGQPQTASPTTMRGGEPQEIPKEKQSSDTSAQQPPTQPATKQPTESIWQKKVTQAEAEDSALTGMAIKKPTGPEALSPEALRADLLRRNRGEIIEPDNDFEPAESDTHEVRAVRTYEADIASTVKHRKASLVHILADQEDARVQERIRVDQTEGQRVKKEASGYVFTMLAGLFVGVGVTIFIVVLVSIGNKTPGVIPVQAIPEFIFTEDAEQLDVTGMDRRAMMTALTSVTTKSEIPLGGVNNVVVTLTEEASGGNKRIRLMKASELFKALELRVSDAFIRSLQDMLMVGVHAFGDREPFLIIQSTFFDNTFAGLLEWEENMNTDLAPWFGAIVTGDTANIATSTEALFKVGLFEDMVIENKEVRVLRDRSGTIVLLYGFPNAQTVVITTNPNTFSEVVTRLSTRRF